MRPLAAPRRNQTSTGASLEGFGSLVGPEGEGGGALLTEEPLSSVCSNSEVRLRRAASRIGWCRGMIHENRCHLSVRSVFSRSSQNRCRG